MKTKNKLRRFCIVCNCQVLHLMQYPDGPEMYLSIHTMTGKPGWWFKLRQCWKILVNGTPYGDQLILSRESILKLKRFIR